jgi:type I restriction enzyme M protein
VRYLELSEKQANLKTQIKDAEVALDTLAYEKYPQLTEAEIKTLVVDDKWLTTLAMAVQGELDRVSQTLTGRIRQLAERYATPLPKLVEEVDALESRVKKHLKKMGAVWN